MAYTPIWNDEQQEILAIAARVKEAHPDAWDEVKVHGQTSRRFINLVSLALLAAGFPAGVNLKRGGPQESLDALAFPNASGAPDKTGTYPGLEIIDIVISAERHDAHLGWADVTQDTINAGTFGGWKAGSLTVSPPPVPAKPILPGREEMMNAGRWLDAFYRAPEGLQRDNGLSINGGPDWEGVGAWLFDVYLQARVNGKSEGDARAAVVAAIRQTDEWKSRHP